MSRVTLASPAESWSLGYHNLRIALASEPRQAASQHRLAGLHHGVSERLPLNHDAPCSNLGHGHVTIPTQPAELLALRACRCGLQANASVAGEAGATLGPSNPIALELPDMLSDFSVHPTIPASDLARARRFYEEILGFKPEQVMPGGVIYRAKGSFLVLFPSSNAGTNQATACGFMVSDLPAVMAELRGRGVRFEEYDMPNLKTVDGIVKTPNGPSAWFKDTEGNVIGLVQLNQPIA